MVRRWFMSLKKINGTFFAGLPCFQPFKLPDIFLGEKNPTFRPPPSPSCRLSRHSHCKVCITWKRRTRPTTSATWWGWMMSCDWPARKFMGWNVKFTNQPPPTEQVLCLLDLSVMFWGHGPLLLFTRCCCYIVCRQGTEPTFGVPSIAFRGTWPIYTF